MANVNRAGLYFAQVKSFGWDAEKLKEKKYQLNIHYQILSMWNGVKWNEAFGGLLITGWHYPLRKDGKKNEGFLKQMMESFGWDGGKLSTLRPAGECQIDVNESEFEGKKSLKVDWVHHWDWAGDAAEANDGADLASIDAAFAAAGSGSAVAPARKQ